MFTLVRDLRYAARSLRHSPGLVLVAVLSLGLGIGVNTTLFTSVKATLFADVSATHPERLVLVSMGGAIATSYPNLMGLRGSGVFADAAGAQLAFFSARVRQEAHRAMGEVVTASYFDVLGVHAAMGRTFSVAEENPALDPRVAVLSYGYWRNRFGGDGGVLGRAIRINGQPFTVIGVLPEGYRSLIGFGIAPEIYVPVGRTVLENYGSLQGERLDVLGRLKDGRSRRQTEAALAVFAAGLERAHPAENRGFEHAGVRLYGVSATERIRAFGAAGGVAAAVGLVVALSGVVLLIACANVAGLLLARGANRRREIAIRLALGAGRGRIVQQLMAESLLLALAGALCGWVLSGWTLEAAGRFWSPKALPIPLEWTFDSGLGLLPFELTLAALTMLLCGLAPARESTRISLVSTLKGGDPSGAPRTPVRRGLRVVAQVAGSLVLLAVGSFCVRSLGRAVHTGPGFEVARILTAEINLDATRFPEAEERRFVAEAVQRVGALPGVESVSASAVAVPAQFMRIDIHVQTDAVSTARPAKMNAVTPGYFATMGIPILRGRDFAGPDRAGAPRVAVVSQTFARMFFREGEALGKAVRVDGEQTVEVVGVVRDSVYTGVGEAPQPVLYEAMAQLHGLGLVLQVRTAGPPSSLTAAVKRELTAMGTDVPVRMATMTERIEQSLGGGRTVAALAAATGAIGMLLALIGLYGLMSQSVTRRTAEFGVRIAMGAAPGTILRDVLSEGLRLVGWGIAAGLVVTVTLVQAVAMPLLGGGQRADLLAMAGPAVLLLIAGAAASYFPARRATRIAPAMALRCE